MTDIIERLEKLVGIHIGDADIDNDLLDAIADIKQLREEIIELKTSCTTFILDLGKAIDEKVELREEIERLQWEMAATKADHQEEIERLEWIIRH